MSSTRGPFKAIVAHLPTESGKMDLKMENVNLPLVGEHEVVVRMVATGICSTDIFTASAAVDPSHFPRVLGHEGAGYVAETGAGVKNAKVGDPVLLSFDSCTTCKMCSAGRPAYCKDYRPINIVGSAGSFFGEDKLPIRGKYFGQSSFAALSIVAEQSIVNVTGLVSSEEELKLLAPLGCGFTTGSGAITNIAQAGPEESVVVFGLGGVGSAAVMAAKVSGCRTIIGVDIVESRLETIKRIGATHVINSKTEDVVAAVKSATDGHGALIAVDSSGNPGMIQAAYDSTGAGGQTILIGLPKPTDSLLPLPIFPFLLSGKQVKGCCLGDAVPSQYLPRLIQWVREGKYPIKEITKMYPVNEFQQALDDMKSGKTVKPVLVW